MMHMTMTKKIYMGADHAGFDRKALLKERLEREGYEVRDFGARERDDQDDYPDYALPLAEAVAKDGVRGILLCGNAQGVCMVANKVDGVRAAMGYSVYAAKSSREDDDSNVLCVPGRALSDEEAVDIVHAWLAADFSGAARHERRLKKVKTIEESH